MPSHVDASSHRRFLIVASPRTGSYLLVQAMNAAAPDVTCFGELLQPTGREFIMHRDQFLRRSPPLFRKTKLKLPQYLGRHVWPGSPRGERGAVGFKAQATHPATAEAIRLAISRFGARCVRLTRKDRAAWATSYVVARCLDQWVYFDRDEPPAQRVVDPALAADLVSSLFARDAAVEALLPKDALRLTYEDLEADLVGSTDAVLACLGTRRSVAAFRLETLPVKTPQSVLSHCVKNYAEVHEIVTRMCERLSAP